MDITAIATDIPAIDSFSGENEFLSNFYPATVSYDGHIYTSVEHAYQAAKTGNYSLRKQIRFSGTAAQAKRIGNLLPKDQFRTDWEHIKFPIMMELVGKKFQDKILGEKLLDTKDAELIEGNHWGDTFWGICEGKGTNYLGKILMETRKKLQPVEIQFSSADALRGYMTTYTGQKFFPTKPNFQGISIYDIAHALSNCCRWGGHCKQFYSVAQHSYHVSYLCDPKDALKGLLHDASEAYLGDMIRPVKYLPEMAIYKTIERGVTVSIAQRFGLDSLEKPESVELADTIMLAKEFLHNRLKHTIPAWVYPLLEKHVPNWQSEGWEVWSPADARAKFLIRYEELTGDRSYIN